MSHTPGPWFEGNGYVQSVSTGLIARVDSPNEADAHLIAAAPELLEALEIMAKEHEAGHGAHMGLCRHESYRNALIALAKARGEK